VRPRPPFFDPISTPLANPPENCRSAGAGPARLANRSAKSESGLPSKHEGPASSCVDPIVPAVCGDPDELDMRGMPPACRDFPPVDAGEFVCYVTTGLGIGDLVALARTDPS